MGTSKRALGNRRKAGSFAIRLAASVVALLLLISLLEAICRIYEWRNPSYRQYDPVLGFTYRPDTRIVLRSDESGRDVELSINGEGFRDLPHEAAKPAGTRRILVLGDSFVAATQVDFEETFHRRLEHLLNRDGTDCRHEVINFGVSGYGTAQELLAFETRGAAYRPDVVILAFFLGNDVGNNSPRLSRDELRTTYALDRSGHLPERPVELPTPLAQGMLATHSAAARFLLGLFDRLAQKLDYYLFTRELTHRYNVFLKNPSDEWLEAWDITGKLLDRLRKRVEEAGARFIVMPIPDAIQVYPELWQHAMRNHAPAREGLLDPEEPLRRINGIIDSYDLEQVALHPEFVGQRTELYFGRGHLNTLGHALTAELLEATVRRFPGDALPCNVATAGTGADR